MCSVVWSYQTRKNAGLLADPNGAVHFVHWPVAFAMISFDTFAGTSAYESNTME